MLTSYYDVVIFFESSHLRPRPPQLHLLHPRLSRLPSNPLNRVLGVMPLQKPHRALGTRHRRRYPFRRTQPSLKAPILGRRTWHRRSLFPRLHLRQFRSNPHLQRPSLLARSPILPRLIAPLPSRLHHNKVQQRNQQLPTVQHQAQAGEIRSSMIHRLRSMLLQILVVSASMHPLLRRTS